MNGTDIERSIPTVSGEVVDDNEYLKIIYNNLGIEAALDSYLDKHSRTNGEQEVDGLLARYANTVAEVADRPTGVDVGIVRIAFDQLTDNMNEVASRHFGHMPQTAGSSALTKLGLKQPEPRQYVRPLDDRYWSQQFMDQYATDYMVVRQAGESEKQFLARYVHGCIHGFLFAPFTLLK